MSIANIGVMTPPPESGQGGVADRDSSTRNDTAADDSAASASDRIVAGASASTSKARHTDEVIRDDARYGASVLRRRGWRLVLLFSCVLLPLWGFTELAEDVHDVEAFAFDTPLLLAANGLSGGGFDGVFLFFSAIGYAWGVVPVDVVLVIVLALRRRLREGLFAGVALGGSALLNLSAKQFFARDRPGLWESIAPESTYSFPSGHAMGSMSLAMVLILLAWPTRGRWATALTMAAFVAMVGLSRVYLGVHYPSDIIAGWLAALMWTVGTYLVVFRHRVRPWAH